MTKDPNGSTLASVQMEVTASEMVFRATFRMRASPSVGARKLQKSTSSANKSNSQPLSSRFSPSTMLSPAFRPSVQGPMTGA